MNFEVSSSPLDEVESMIKIGVKLIELHRVPIYIYILERWWSQYDLEIDSEDSVACN